ncbi:MAG: hypothetical protein ACM3ZF_16345 [Mycobacterium leprae]
MILPTGIATDATTQYFFRDLVESGSLASLYDFENRKPLFEGVDSRFKFCLLTLAGRGWREVAADFAFFLHEPADLAKPDVRFALKPDEITLLNPNTKTLPVFRSRRDAEITLGIYRRVPVLIREGDPDGNPWGVSFTQGLFNMTSDSHLFRTRAELEAEGWRLDGNVFVRGRERMLPLYEAKMLHHYDHRWATYEPAGATREVTLKEKQDPNFVVLPRYWVAEKEVEAKLAGRWDHQWLLGWRDITNTTNERTTIATLFPFSAVGHTTPVAFVEHGAQLVPSVPDLQLPEPTSHAFAFAYESRRFFGGQRSQTRTNSVSLVSDVPIGNYVVVDIGGGTTDIALLRVSFEEDKLRVDVGNADGWGRAGDEVDKAVAERLIRRLTAEHASLSSQERGFLEYRLRQVARGLRSS